MERAIEISMPLKQWLDSPDPIKVLEDVEKVIGRDCAFSESNFVTGRRVLVWYTNTESDYQRLLTNANIVKSKFDNIEITVHEYPVDAGS